MIQHIIELFDVNLNYPGAAVVHEGLSELFDRFALIPVGSVRIAEIIKVLLVDRFKDTCCNSLLSMEPNGPLEFYDISLYTCHAL
jgi:hypothetical protein